MVLRDRHLGLTGWLDRQDALVLAAIAPLALDHCPPQVHLQEPGVHLIRAAGHAGVVCLNAVEAVFHRIPATGRVVTHGWLVMRRAQHGRELSVRAMTHEPLPACRVERAPEDGPEHHVSRVLHEKGQLPAVDRLVPVLRASRGQAHGVLERVRAQHRAGHRERRRERLRVPESHRCAAAHRFAFCSPFAG
jgi:hypothetical protein